MEVDLVELDQTIDRILSMESIECKLNSDNENQDQDLLISKYKLQEKILFYVREMKQIQHNHSLLRKKQSIIRNLGIHKIFL